MKFALLLARQRSGTGALGSVLDQHAELSYLGEVFHPQNRGQANNYFTYAMDRIRKEPELALPGKKEKLFLDFLESQSEVKPGATLVVDVKYRSLHQLDGDWHGLVQMPRIVELARSMNAPILHLTRKNAVESFVSGRLAEANKVWHATEKHAIDVTSVVVVVRQLSNYVVMAQREHALIEEWLAGYDKMMAVDYADMFDKAGDIAAPVAQKLTDTLGVAAMDKRAPAFRKQAPRALRDSIENFDIVQQALRGTDYHWMVR